MSKSKTPKTNKPVLVNILLDESGSMASCRDQTIAGFNEYVQSLKKSAPNALLSVTKFNSSGVTELCVATPVSDVPVLSSENYSPSWWTPLYDAIGRTITTGKEFLDSQKKKMNALMIIQTDGHENDSKEYKDVSKLKALMDSMEEKGWTFVFLGGDLDTAQATTSMGLRISGGNQFGYATSDTRTVYANTLSAATINYCATGGEKTENFFSGSE